MPAKQVSNAVGAYSVRVEPNEVVALIDDTAFGSGKDGILICENRLVIRQVFASARAYDYDAIESISCEGRRLFINEHEAYKLVQPDKHGLAELFELMNQWISRRGVPTAQNREPRAAAPASGKSNAAMGEFLYNLGRKVVSDKVYVRPHIPAKKLQSALDAYGNGLSPEDVIILVDDTAFGSAKDGILITGKSIYIKIFTESLRAYEWDAVESIDIEKRTIYINGTASGKLVQATEKDLGFLFDCIDENLSQQSSSSELQLDPSINDQVRGAEVELTFDLDVVLQPEPQRNDGVTDPREDSGFPEQESNLSIAQDEATAIATVVEAEVSANHPAENGSAQADISLPVTAKESKAKDKLLAYISTAIEQNKSKILPMIKEKTGEASLAALRDDSNVEKLAGFIYAFLPGLVRFALKEQVFVQFMLDNRDKILAGLLPAEANVELSREEIASVDGRTGNTPGLSPKEPIKKLAAFARGGQVSTVVRPSFYLRTLGEYEQFMAEFPQKVKSANRAVQNSDEFKEYVRGYHITKYCADTLSLSIEALARIRDRLALSDHAARSAFELDSVIFVMLSYATTSMSFLLRSEAGYDEDQVANLLAPALDILIVSYATDLLGHSATKTLRDTVNPYERVLASETMKSYKTMSSVFSKNIERQDGESLSGYFEHFVVRSSVDVFEEPNDRFELSSKMSSDEGRQVVLSVLAELDAQLESALVQHLEDRSSW
ncbi:MAG: hypothetical protein E6Q71_00025 [Pseudomonas sp.]|nr:MAG: hypothetical protein E6Q71_00025 [Pseudomonas sp.]